MQNLLFHSLVWVFHNYFCECRDYTAVSDVHCNKSDVTENKLKKYFQDELENLRRSSQIEKNQLETQLSAKNEEIRHLSTSLEISKRSQVSIASSDVDDKVALLLRERKMMENRLEEQYLHLRDIKSSWTSQNLTLENQVNRLSRQIMDETAEKKKVYDEKASLCERIKQLETNLLKVQNELEQRDNKVTNFFELDLN